MKTKKQKVGNVPNLRFPGFEGDWESKNLGDLLEFKNGINATKEQYGTGYKFINVLDILNNDYLTHTKIVGKVNVNQATVDKYPVNYGDILFQRSSETREEVGTANVYLDKDYTATFGGFVIRGRKIADYNPIFLNKLLKTNSIRNSITSRSGGSTRYNVGQETLSSTNVILPPVSEQHKIATFLSLLDIRIETQNKIIEELELLKKSISKKLLSARLRLINHTEIHYEKWTLKELGDLCEIVMGQSPDSRFYNTFEQGVPLIQGKADIVDRFTEPRNWTTHFTKTCDVGDLILTVRAPVGSVALSLHNACIGRGVCAIRKKSENSLMFIYHFLIEYEDKWGGLEQGSTFSAVSGNEIKKIKINVPSFAEQLVIANCLSAFDQRINLEKALLHLYKAQKEHLSANLFI